MGQPEFKRGPWTCRWASIAAAVRSTSSAGSPDVIWTCDLRDPSTEANLFLQEECEDCNRWEASTCPPSAGPPRRLTLLLPDDTRPSPVVATTCRYERGERIFDEGATSEFFYTVASGSVKLVKTSCRGHDCIVGIASGICPLNPDGLSFPATAVALEDTTCLLVPKRELVALFENNPTAAQRLWDELCESLDAGFTWTAEFGHGTVEVRLARFFLRLARTAGRPQGSVTFIPVPLSRQELADAVGTAIETCIRLMSRWEERCLIYACDGGFMVSDEEQLELLAAATTPHPDRRSPAPDGKTPARPRGY